MNSRQKNWMYLILFLCFIFLNLMAIAPVNAGVLSNEQLTISVGNEQSWTGRNGTGNLSYYGCDEKCDCIYLTGGKISCRNGVCQTSWKNKQFSYILSSPITKAERYGQTPSTLKILADTQVILESTLYPKAFDNLDSRN